MLTPDHKAALPLHYSAYLAEVGCKKSASANVESVFSGAGNFMEQLGTSGSTLLERMVKLYYNWKYEFVHPTFEEVLVDRYALPQEVQGQYHVCCRGVRGSPCFRIQL